MANDIWGKLIDLGLSFFKKDLPKVVAKEVAKPQDLELKVEAIPVAPTVVNWADPNSKISKYFTVREAITLREWKRLANESDGLNDTVKANLISIFQKLDVIREFLGRPIFVKSAYRPSAYNVAIGGSKQSAHMADKDYGAVDFWCDQDGDGDKDGEDYDLIKEKLMPKLAGWGLRMEDNGKGARWVHVDSKPVPQGGNIFFKP